MKNSVTVIENSDGIIHKMILNGRCFIKRVDGVWERYSERIRTVVIRDKYFILTLDCMMEMLLLENKTVSIQPRLHIENRYERGDVVVEGRIFRYDGKMYLCRDNGEIVMFMITSQGKFKEHPADATVVEFFEKEYPIYLKYKNQ